ncbi:MAG: hypothetical protein OXC92_10955 [Flavobacteriaceae bacterium]|nr:hypothetical protein [Flavobacteriaceae bacterium]
MDETPVLEPIQMTPKTLLTMIVDDPFFAHLKSHHTATNRRHQHMNRTLVIVNRNVIDWP